MARLRSACTVPRAENHGLTRLRMPFLTLCVLLANLNFSSSSVTVNGARFQLTAEKVWSAPKLGKLEQVRVAVQMTNERQTPTRFYLVDGFTINLQETDGKKLRKEAGRDHYVPGTPSTPSLRLQESWVFTGFGAKLVSTGAGLRLEGEDAYGNYWCFPDLHPGRFKLSVDYRPANRIEADYWSGALEGLSVEIEIR